VSHHSKTEAHKVRAALEPQLAYLWANDPRLKDVNPSDIRSFKKSRRFLFDVRQQELGQTVTPTATGLHGFHEVRGIRFVPLATRWRYLRCDLSMRIWRHEGDFHTGGLLDQQGDLDGTLKALIDALRMPHTERELPAAVKHSKPVFFACSRMTVSSPQSA